MDFHLTIMAREEEKAVWARSYESSASSQQPVKVQSGRMYRVLFDLQFVVPIEILAIARKIKAGRFTTKDRFFKAFKCLSTETPDGYQSSTRATVGIIMYPNKFTEICM